MKAICDNCKREFEMTRDMLQEKRDKGKSLVFFIDIVYFSILIMFTLMTKGLFDRMTTDYYNNEGITVKLKEGAIINKTPLKCQDKNQQSATSRNIETIQGVGTAHS